MKIAVIYYGFLRNWHWKNHKTYLIDKYDCDVYANVCSTAYDPKYWDWYPNTIQKSINIQDINNAYNEKLKGVCIFDYQEQKYIDLIRINKCNPTNWVGQTSWRIASMLDNMSRAVKLMLSSGIKYDKCIILRGDVLFYNDFDINAISDDKINFPIGEGFNNNGDRNFGLAAVYGTGLGLNDQIICGSLDLIKIFEKLYEEIVNLHLQGAEFNAETLIGKFLISKNILFEATDLVTYKLDR